MATVTKNPYISKEYDRIEITETGKKYLSNILTDDEGDVYVFTDKASPLLVAASMARLSRRGSDLREIYLDEFACTGADKASDLLKRVITAYGDDSVQQLLSMSLVVENASNILTKKLEWGRLAAYLEQSTRYIYFDEKNRSGKFRYYTPGNLSPQLQILYRESMNAIFEKYSFMVRGLYEYLKSKIPEPREKAEHIAWSGAIRAQACDAVRSSLPAATTSTVGIVASAQSIESLILHLASDPTTEAKECARRILREVRKVAPVFFERADIPERGGAIIVHRMDTARAIKEDAAKFLSQKTSTDTKLVELIDYWPRDEFDVIPEILFAYSDGLSLSEIRAEVATWEREKKQHIFASAVGDRLNRRHKPGRAFEKIHYEWQITGDYGTFRDLQRHRVVDGFEWQSLSPLRGYEVPLLVLEGGYEKNFRECFEISQKLWSVLFEQGYKEEAQYATLLGHRMRYRFLLNARASFHFHELRTSPQGHPGYRKIVQEMHRQLCEVHPNIGAAMRFVNLSEDPELTRLASERATQRKLELLERIK
jgi:thymidylate synthase ThyX